MLLNGDGVLAGAELKTSDKGTYCIVRILETSGKTFEVITRDMQLIDNIMRLQKLQNYTFIVDITQGKYPRYELQEIGKVIE